MNVIVYRLNVGESPLKGRSFCPKCRKTIHWFDNIPLFSFLLLKGRCRHCQTKISLQYPLVEAGMGLVWVGLYFFLAFEPVWELIFYFLSSWLLVGIFVSDLRYQTIPDHLSFGLAGLGLAWIAISGLWSNLAVGLGAGLFFYLLHVGTKKKGMGLGDVKLVPGLGFILGGEKTLVGLYLAFLTGACVGVGLILLGKKKFGQKIAFGPFSILSAVVSFLWSEFFIETWFNLLKW
ncbi:prepilin peptidase [Patescibacteria group bacterium]|nr:prepilin peptidase [Patescibacteria group bacterium]